MSIPTSHKSLKGTSSWISLGLSPVFDHTGDKPSEASRPDVEGRMNENGYGRLVATKDGEVSDESKMVYYLFGRNVSIEAIRDILNSPDARRRLMQILRTNGNDVSLKDDESMHLWTLCQKAVIRLNGLSCESYLIYNAQTAPLTNHFQPAKDCYMVAAAVTVASKISLCNKKLPGLTIDGNNLVRNLLRNDEFVERVLHNKGGNSRMILERLTPGYAKSSLAIQGGDQSQWQFLVDCLSRHGPGLISRFRTDGNFPAKRISLYEDREVILLPRFDRVDGEDKWDHLKLKMADGMTVEKEEKKVDSISQLIDQSRQRHKGTDQADTQPDVVTLSSSSNSDALASEDTDILDHDNDDRMDVGGDEGTPEGRHAMVLVGSVNVEGKVWFLLQNSWKGLPLFLVSTSVLEDRMSGSTVTFIIGDVTEAPDHVNVAQSRVVESDICIDYGDNEEYEEEYDGIDEEDYQEE